MINHYFLGPYEQPTFDNMECDKVWAVISFHLAAWKSKTIEILSQSLTWNLKMMVSKRNLLFQGAIFRFHVKFWEGMCLQFWMLKTSLLKKQSLVKTYFSNWSLDFQSIAKGWYYPPHWKYTNKNHFIKYPVLTWPNRPTNQPNNCFGFWMCFCIHPFIVICLRNVICEHRFFFLHRS